MSIAANKVTGIRAANAHSEVEAQLSREHNPANVLALGGRLLDPQLGLGSWIAGSAPAFILPINESLTIRQKHRAPRVPELGKLEYLVGQ